MGLLYFYLYPFGGLLDPRTSITIFLEGKDFSSYRDANPGRSQPVSMSLHLLHCPGLCVQDKRFQFCGSTVLRRCV